jgi:hypothetical protein
MSSRQSGSIHAARKQRDVVQLDEAQGMGAHASRGVQGQVPQQRREAG